jgi:hypothetical protein
MSTAYGTSAVASCTIIACGTLAVASRAITAYGTLVVAPRAINIDSGLPGNYRTWPPVQLRLIEH